MANVKSQGLPNKKSSPSNVCLKSKNGVSFGSLSIAENTYYTPLAGNLVLKLPKPPNNFGIQSINSYSKKCNLKEKLLFTKTEYCAIIFGQRTFFSIIKLVFRAEREFCLFYYDAILSIEIEVIIVKKLMFF